jgi:predicted transcriptional regulator of viral defense system
MRTQPQTRPVNALIAEVAGRQHGVVARSQLRGLGLSGDSIGRRIRQGGLHRLHPGVFAVGHLVVPREGRWLAAVLASEPEAVLSHRSAAALWGLLRDHRPSPIDVTTPRKSTSTGSIRRHYARCAVDEVTIRKGIPVTSLARTLLDYAAGHPAESLDAAMRQAEYLHRVRPEALRGYLGLRRGRRGVARLRECVSRLEEGPRGRTRSPLEDRFASLLTRAGLPPPELNILLDLGELKIEADCIWRSQRLIVELDGRRAHDTRSAQAADRTRDQALQAAGWHVLRATWQDVEEPEATVAKLRRLLAQSVSACE